MVARRLLIAGVFVIISIGLLVTGTSSVNQLACEGQPINFLINPTVEQQLWGERTISQSFVAPRNGLNRIDILFQTYQRQNTHDVTLNLLEITPNSPDPRQGLNLFEFTFNAATVHDRVWRNFTFFPILDSAGKTYLIMLRSSESVPGNAITVGGIEWDAYEPGTAFLGTVPVRADIAFRACYQMTTLEKLQVLSEQMTRNRPALWGNIGFYWLILGVYGLLLLGFFWKLTKLVL